MWKTEVIKTYGKHRGVKLVGYLNYETGAVYCEEHDTYDAEVFLGFLKNTLEMNEGGKNVIFWDNARIHHTKLIQPFLKENEDKLCNLWRSVKKTIYYLNYIGTEILTLIRYLF